MWISEITKSGIENILNSSFGSEHLYTIQLIDASLLDGKFNRIFAFLQSK